MSQNTNHKNVVVLTVTVIMMTLLTLPTQLKAADTKKQKVRQLPFQLRKYDKNSDGKISAEEMPAKSRKQLLAKYDTNQNNVLEQSELKVMVHDKRQAKGKSPKAPKVRSTFRAPVDYLLIHKDIAYTNEKENKASLQKLDLYIPKGQNDFPILVWIHGGGLHGGDKSKAAEVAERFALEGFGVAVLNYRLSPAVKYPAHIEDVAAA